MSEFIEVFKSVLAKRRTNALVLPYHSPEESGGLWGPEIREASQQRTNEQQSAISANDCARLEEEARNLGKNGVGSGAAPRGKHGTTFF